MKRTMMALALVGGLAMPALAQEESEGMICSDFMALSADEQMTAMTTAQLGEEAEAAEATAPDQETVDAVVAGCTEQPEMTLGEAMTAAMGE
jgi:hypothetical protein